MPSPVSTPAVRYSSKRRVAKDARIMPAEASSPPTSITGRQPKRVTRMLDTGPVDRAESQLGMDNLPLQKTHCRLCTSQPWKCLPQGALGINDEVVRLSWSLIPTPSPGPGEGVLTGAIEHGEHDGGHPGRVTVAGTKVAHERAEEDAHGLGEAVGETGDHEAGTQHGPAPATIWGAHAPPGAGSHLHCFC